MRFTAAIFTTLAVGALAAVAPEVEEEDFSTVLVTETTTLCPESTAGALPVSSDLPASITVSDGITYSISRPLITSTVTYCNECPSIPISTPTISPTPSSSSIVVIPTSRPLIPTAPVEVPPVPAPSASAPSGASPETESESTTAPAGPLFTGAASRAAGAGAGLAGVFALVAYLL